MLGVSYPTRCRRPPVNEYDGKQFVGIDLHRRHSVIVRQSESGDQLSAVRIVNDPVALRLELERAGTDPEVVLEATYGWYWAVDVLRDCGAQVHLAHPLGVKGFRYRRVKNDVRDAGDLADLLRMNRLPEAWIAPPATRELRELVRYRAKLVALRSGLKAQAHAVLAKAGVLIAVSDLFGVEGRQAPGPGAARRRLRAAGELAAGADRRSRRPRAAVRPADRRQTSRRSRLLGDSTAARRRPDPRCGIRRRNRGRAPLRRSQPPVFVGRSDLNTASPTRLSAAGTSPSRAPNSCGGRPWRPSNASRPARTSPRSPRPASCSPSSTAGCATGTSGP